MINYDHFSQIELKIGKILSAERVEGSDKLLKLQVDLGSPSINSGTKINDSLSLPADRQGEVEGQSNNEVRQVLAGIGKVYAPESLIGKEIVVVANLEPRILMGLESQGMLLAASGPDGPVILMPEKEVPPGSGVK